MDFLDNVSLLSPDVLVSRVGLRHSLNEMIQFYFLFFRETTSLPFTVYRLIDIDYMFTVIITSMIQPFPFV